MLSKKCAYTKYKVFLATPTILLLLNGITYLQTVI